MTSLSIDQMYRVLRGLPGKMELSSPAGENYVLTVVNPNAPANRCQETPGLSVILDGPIGSANASSSHHHFTDGELDLLRTGEPVTLNFGQIEVELQSNPGGHMVVLEDEEELVA